PITVGVTLPGRLHKVSVANGQKVKEGQVVAQLDDGQARADLALARARRDNAERLLDRTRTLLAAQAATPSDLDKATGQAEIAKAELLPIQQRIDQGKVRSPITGTILEVLAHKGEEVVGNAGVVKVADLTQL